jgi:hypothetical protein
MIAGTSILQSGSPFAFAPPQHTSAGITLLLNAADTNPVQIESSRDMLQWFPATNFTRTGYSQTFPTEHREFYEFYRARATNKP